MTTEVLVHFTVTADSPEHAVLIVKHYLEGKGVHEQGEEELTLGKSEEWFGWSKVYTKDDPSTS